MVSSSSGQERHTVPKAFLSGTLVVLIALASLAACANREPSQAPRPTEFSSTVEATRERAPGKRFRANTILRQAVQKVFDTWTQALRANDASLLHATLSKSLAESCEISKVQEWIQWNGASVLEDQATQVISVFLDAENPDRALAALHVGAGPDGTESQSRPAAMNQIQLFPFPIVMEEGMWRISLPYQILDSSLQPCPFEMPVLPEEERLDSPNIPGLDFDELYGLSLDSPLGSMRSFSSRRSGRSRDCGTYPYRALFVPR